jgi:GntP family gluconate:H+ symporter
MSPLVLLLIGMAIVVGGILALRLHAFLALILGAFAVALLTPETALRQHADARVAKSEMTAKTATKFVDKPASGRVAEEFGRTCANLGILIAMATIIGEAMLLSGAAERIAATLLRWFGATRAHWAFFTAAFVLCIPVMLDTVMYLLAPLFKALARKTGRDYLLLVMCTVAGGTITHSLVPPTPGPLFVAGDLGVPLGLMIGMGSAIGLGAALVGVVFARWSNHQHVLEVPLEDAPAAEDRILPALWVALLPVVLPIVLIGLDATFTDGLKITGGWLAWFVKTIGDKDMALTLGALAALAPLAGRGGDGAKAVKSAVSEGAVILLIIGAGGAFGGVLQQTGIAGNLAGHFQGIHHLALPTVFIVTCLVRTAQGSATVAMITAAPIAKALIVGGAQIHPVYFAIAIGCGSKPFPWMNDAGFWIISRLSGMRESLTLRTISPMMSIQGVAGLILTMLSAWLWPMR